MLSEVRFHVLKKQPTLLILGFATLTFSPQAAVPGPDRTEGDLGNTCVRNAGSALCGDDRQLSHSEVHLNFTSHIDSKKEIFSWMDFIPLECLLSELDTVWASPGKL